MVSVAVAIVWIVGIKAISLLPFVGQAVAVGIGEDGDGCELAYDTVGTHWIAREDAVLDGGDHGGRREGEEIIALSGEIRDESCGLAAHPNEAERGRAASDT